jgi:hypothetical protein
MYLAYARHDPAIDGDAVIASAQALLDAGPTRTPATCGTARPPRSRC